MNALEKFRDLDSHIRARVVTILSVTIGLVLASFWVSALPGWIREATASASSGNIESPFSILQTIRGGSAMVYQNFQGAIESAKQNLSVPKSVTVTPNNP